MNEMSIGSAPCFVNLSTMRRTGYITGSVIMTISSNAAPPALPIGSHDKMARVSMSSISTRMNTRSSVLANTIAIILQFLGRYNKSAVFVWTRYGSFIVYGEKAPDQ